MNETVVMWANLLVIALAALFFGTRLVASKYGNKVVMLLDIVALLILAVIFTGVLYTAITGTYQSVSIAGIIVVIVLFLIVRKEFLNNLREVARIVKGT